MFECHDAEFPIARGEAHDWSADGRCRRPHVHWECPLCWETHITDVDRNGGRAFLWPCEEGEGLVLVCVPESPLESPTATELDDRFAE